MPLSTYGLRRRVPPHFSEFRGTLWSRECLLTFCPLLVPLLVIQNDVLHRLHFGSWHFQRKRVDRTGSRVCSLPFIVNQLKAFARQQVNNSWVFFYPSLKLKFSQKMAPVYFAITLLRLLYWKNYGHTYIPINLEQNDIKIVNLSSMVPCKTQHTHSWAYTSRMGLSVTIVVSNVEMNETLYEVWNLWTNDATQQ